MDSMDSFKNLGIMTNPSLMELKRRCYCIKLAHVEEKGDGSTYSFWGIKRHYLEEFLLFCFNYFKLVIVWSAGKKNYVNAIVDNIFKNLRKPHLVWTFDDIDTDKDGNVEKPITKLINSNFIYKHHLNPAKIIVVDDNVTTFVKNKKNAICIPPFEPELNVAALSTEDTALLQLKYWLLLPHVINCNDVTKLDLNNVFTDPYETYIEIANSYDYY
jgi:TFIIF-interacting CTD phosphatase-like protein